MVSRRLGLGGLLRASGFEHGAPLLQSTADGPAPHRPTGRHSGVDPEGVSVSLQVSIARRTQDQIVSADKTSRTVFPCDRSD